MTLPIFPASCGFPKDGWNIQPKPNFVETEFDGGNTRERQRFTREVRVVSLTWAPLDAAQLVDFMLFWSQLGDSGGEFEYEHPLAMSPGNTPVTYVFKRLGAYEHNHIEGEMHEIRMRLEEVLS